MLHISTDCEHESQLHLQQQLVTFGKYQLRGTTCQNCGEEYSRNTTRCICEQTSFPYLEIRCVLSDKSMRQWFAYVIRCTECGERSDSGIDECICGSTPLSFVMFVPEPKDVTHKKPVLYTVKHTPVSPQPIANVTCFIPRPPSPIGC
jgi:hypothetical protein